MTRENFKLMHSELIMDVQCIERDLKLIYAGMHSGNFEKNLDVLEKANLGTVIKKLKELDYSDGNPCLSERDYALLEQIRDIRNYWCHQCYVDYLYIKDDWEREKTFEAIANRLKKDGDNILKLGEETERLRIKLLREFDRI